MYAVIQQWLRLRKQHRNKPFVTALSGEIKLLRTGVITAVWTVAVFVFFMIRVTYTDHNLLEQTQRELTQLQNQSPYARSLLSG